MTARLLLTEEEAAEALCLCARTLRKARQEGKLRYVKYGRAIRYSPQDLSDFIDEQRRIEPQKPAGPKPAPKPRGNGKVVPFSQRV